MVSASDRDLSLPICYVNGNRCVLPRDVGHLSLLEYLRGESTQLKSALL